MSAKMNKWYGHPLDPRRKVTGHPVPPGDMLRDGIFRAAPNGRWELVEGDLFDHVVKEGEMTFIPPASPQKLVNGDASNEGQYQSLYIIPAEDAKKEWLEVNIVFGTKERARRLSIKYLRRKIAAFLREEGIEKFEIKSPSRVRTIETQELKTNTWSATVRIFTEMKFPPILTPDELW